MHSLHRRTMEAPDFILCLAMCKGLTRLGWSFWEALSAPHYLDCNKKCEHIRAYLHGLPLLQRRPCCRCRRGRSCVAGGGCEAGAPAIAGGEQAAGTGGQAGTVRLDNLLRFLYGDKSAWMEGISSRLLVHREDEASRNPCCICSWRMRLQEAAAVSPNT